MAMTLRLDEEQERALTFLAESAGVSKQEAATRAIMAAADRLGHESRRTELSERYRERYAEVLKRLGE